MNSSAIRHAGHVDDANALLQRVLDDANTPFFDIARVHEVFGDEARAADSKTAIYHYRLALEASPSLSGTSGEIHLKIGEILLESISQSNVSWAQRIIKRPRAILSSHTVPKCWPKLSNSCWRLSRISQ